VRLEVTISQVKQNLLGVLDTLLNLAEEEDGFTTIDDSVIVSEGNVHDRSGQDLAAYDGRAELGCVHAEDSTLRHVDDRSTHHRSEDSSVGDGEGASSHVLESDLVVTGLSGETSESQLELSETHVVTVTNDRDDQSGGSGDSSGDVDEVTVDHISIIDNSVNNRLLL